MLQADLVSVLTQKLMLPSLWYCSRPRGCFNMRPFEEGAERSRGPLNAWSAEAVLRASHEQTRNAGGCDGAAELGKRRMSECLVGMLMQY
jgi:hypothetical protein